MKIDPKCWIGPIVKAKQAKKDAGEIKGDADLAASVSLLLEEVGLPGVDRGGLNHWLTGKRQPSVAQFLALCGALDIAPEQAFGGGMRRLNRRMDPAVAEAVSIMESTDTAGQAMALTGIKFALKDYQGPIKQTA